MVVGERKRVECSVVCDGLFGLWEFFGEGRGRVVWFLGGDFLSHWLTVCSGGEGAKTLAAVFVWAQAPIVYVAMLEAGVKFFRTRGCEKRLWTGFRIGCWNTCAYKRLKAFIFSPHWNHDDQDFDGLAFGVYSLRGIDHSAKTESGSEDSQPDHHDMLKGFDCRK